MQRLGKQLRDTEREREIRPNGTCGQPPFLAGAVGAEMVF